VVSSDSIQTTTNEHQCTRIFVTRTLYYYPSVSFLPSKIQLNVPPSISFKSLFLLPLPLGEGWGEGSFAAIPIGCGQRLRQVHSWFKSSRHPTASHGILQFLRSLSSLRLSIPLFRPQTLDPRPSLQTRNPEPGTLPKYTRRSTWPSPSGTSKKNFVPYPPTTYNASPVRTPPVHAPFGAE
jgi:hypothetical protein